MISGLVLADTVHFSTGQNGTDVTGIIASNTTWTKTNSPYTITGPVAVNTGVTLIIEDGATVNLNKRYIQVNGSLIARGSSNDPIHISDGTLNFTIVSNGWNEQTGSGSIFENVVFYQVVVDSSVALKVRGCSGDSRSVEGGLMRTSIVSVSGSSIVLDNTLYSVSVTDGSAVITNNNLSNVNINGGSPSISNNTILGITGSGGSPTITNNLIESIGGYNNYFDANSPIISNNTITGGILLYGTSPTISNNIIMGYIYGTSLAIADGYGGGKTIEGLIDKNPIVLLNGKGGSPIISDNLLTGHTYNYTHQTFYGGLRGTTSELVVTNGIVLGGHNLNLHISNNNATGIIYGANGAGIIQDNSLTEIVITATPNLTIERNLINNGVADNSGANLTIRNNTITSGGIRLQKSATINFNNIQNYSQNSIFLSNTPNNVDATFNWWGTTNVQAINQTIYDFKNDFNLGRVNFVPFLTEPNPQAVPNPNTSISTPSPTPTSTPSATPAQTVTPTQSQSPTPNLTPSPSIPELSAWIVLPLAMISALLSVFALKSKKKILTNC